MIEALEQVGQGDDDKGAENSSPDRRQPTSTITIIHQFNQKVRCRTPRHPMSRDKEPEVRPTIRRVRRKCRGSRILPGPYSCPMHSATSSDQAGPSARVPERPSTMPVPMADAARRATFDSPERNALHG